MTRRAVITGIGVVAPTGIGADHYWKATREGTSGIRPISHFDASRYPVKLAGEVQDFQVNDFVEQRLVVQTDRWTQLAMAASQMALEDASFDPSTSDPYQMSVVTSSAMGGNEFGQREIQNLWGKGPRFVGAYQSIAWFYAATTGQLCIRHRMKGASSVIVADAAGGLDALGHARRTVRRGTDVVVAGGTEAPVAPYALTCQLATRHLSEATDPSAAYLPFDVRANGHVPAEGGAVLLVEDLEHARTRGAPFLYAEIVGHASTNDAHHHLDPAPDGHHLQRAMELALERAGVPPEDVDVVFADGAGEPGPDAAEAKAIHAVFGSRHGTVPVTVPKSAVGRMCSGGGALDVATAALALRHGCIPPTINVAELGEGCDFDLVRNQARPAQLRTALLMARGVGGFNSALVLRQVGD